MVGVSKTFPPQKQVLKNIYLSFFYGAKIGIIGLNGSGKSTLLKIIAGIEKDYQGEVVFSPGYSFSNILDSSFAVKGLLYSMAYSSIRVLIGSLILFSFTIYQIVALKHYGC